MIAQHFWFQKSYRVTREHKYRARTSLKDTEGVLEMRHTTEQNDNINAWAACTLAHVIVSKAVKEKEAAQQENIMTGLHFLSTGVNGPRGTQNSMKANIKVCAV